VLRSWTSKGACLYYEYVLGEHGVCKHRSKTGEKFEVDVELHQVCVMSC
jgi:hypothetical protein